MKVLKLDKKHFIGRKLLSVLSKEAMKDFDDENIEFEINNLLLERKNKKWVIKGNIDIKAETENLKLKGF